MNRAAAKVLAFCFLLAAGCATAADKQVVFVCTGNFYRSRFAEVLFNQKASEAQLKWHAISRGLNLVPWQFGISEYAQKELLKRGVEKQSISGGPRRLTTRDLEQSDCIIIMDEAEHRALFEKKFSKLNRRNIQYWHVPDAGKLKPPEACNIMAQNIEQLISSLKND